MNRWIGLVSLVSLFLVHLPASGQAQQWAWTYGGLSDDFGNTAQETADGGVVVVGETRSFGAALTDVWVVKLTGTGSISWEKRYGGAESDSASHIEQTSDGGYVVAGTTGSFGATAGDAWVLKLAANGSIEWEKRYGGSGYDSAVHIRQTSPDGGYIVAGRTESFGATNGDLWALKLDSDGDIEWQNRYGGGHMEWAAHIRQTADGGYIVIGGISAANGDYWVLKLNGVGGIVWQKSYGMRTFVPPNIYNDNSDYGYQVLQTSDDGYLLVGESNPSPAGNRYAWLVKTDSDGEISWQTMYSYGACLFSSIHQTSDGSYALAGRCDGDSWIVKLDGSGDFMWGHRYGTPGDSTSDVLRSVWEITGGGLIAAGDMDSFGEGGKDLWVLKLDDTGQFSGCSVIGDLSVVGEDTTAIPAVTAELATGTDVPTQGVATAATISDTEVVRRDGCGIDEDVSLPRTGQTATHYPGDDGNLQMGVAWPEPRFEDNLDGTMTDGLTGLTWLQDADCAETIGHNPDGYGPGRMSWASAMAFVAGINDGTYAGCGAGHDDWRVPNVIEMESMVNLEHFDQAEWLNGQGFSNVPVEDYWSSNRHASTSWMRWIVRMYDGTVGRSSSGSANCVWPVRLGQRRYSDPAYPANLWKTGQTTSFYPGDDGDLKMGVIWPDPRLSDNGEGTVTDNLTGLVWLQDADCLASSSWENAHDTVADFNLNPGSYSCDAYDTQEHREGWRVPNRKELISLMDYSRNGPALPPGHPFLNTDQSNVFWTSTTYMQNNPVSPAAWVIYVVSMGAVDVFLKDHGQPDVWPVRGGSGVFFTDGFETGDTSRWSSTVP